MPNLDDLKTSKYLKKSDVEPPVQATIKSYEQVNVAMENQPQELKYVLHFNELEKPLVLNATNGELIAMIVNKFYGVQTNPGDFDNWIGKRVELWNDPTVGFGGKITGGIRIRPLPEHLQGGATAPVSMNDAQAALDAAKAADEEPDWMREP